MSEEPSNDSFCIVNGFATDFVAAQRDLARRVNQRLEEGWIAQGGVICLGTFNMPDGQHFVFSQALIKPLMELKPEPEVEL
jgi:hypothetical protein